MLDYEYTAANAAAGAPKLVVNTSCEHLDAFDRWYGRIPDGQLLALQSNDYFACSEHVNCVPDLATFQERAPMRDVLFAGEHKLRRYVRFMAFVESVEGEYLRFGKAPRFGDDLELVLQLDLAELHKGWNGVKCVYRRVR